MTLDEGRSKNGRFSGWNPVAMTVTLTRVSHSSRSEMTPKLICASSQSGGLADDRAGLVDLVQSELAGAGDIDQDAARSGDAACPRAADS